MKPPDFLRVLPADIGRVGFDGAAVLALVRYVTGLPGETNGRKTVDGEKWWRATRDDIGEALGGVHRDSVRRTLIRLCSKGELLARPAEAFYGDRAQEYRVSDMPLRGGAQCSDMPLRGGAQCITRNRVSSSRETASAADAKVRNLPSVGELSRYSVGEKGARTDEREPLDAEVVPEPANDPSHPHAPGHPQSLEPIVASHPAVNGKPKADLRGTRLLNGWEPDRTVIDAMRAECPRVDLRAEHRKFVDYWAGVPGVKGRKVDWDATWRNWIRKAAEYGRTHQSSSVSDNVTGWLDRAQQIESDDESRLW